MSIPGKRVGFVDYKLENWHSNAYLGAMRKELLSRGFEVTGGTALDADAGQAWTKKNNVPYFNSVKELDAHCDVYFILAPSNPELHLELCKNTFPCGKPTYVDKTFAPDLKTAKAIFKLADRYQVPIQTSSALRYTSVQKAAAEMGKDQIMHMVTWGGGRSFGEYSVHPLELMISVMGPQVQSLMRRGEDEQTQLLLNFTGGRTGVVNVYPNWGVNFAATMTTPKETRYVPVDNGRLFIDACDAILTFLETGKPTIDRAESLVIRAIQDKALEPTCLKRFVKIAI